MNGFFPMVWVLLFSVFFVRASLGEGLARLDDIASRYSTMGALLDDEAGLREYREALKAYMGENESFDPVFAEFVRQIRDVSQKVPGFSEKAWKQDPTWRKKRFSLRGEAVGSGLEVKRDEVAKAVSAIEEEAKKEAKVILEVEDRATKVNALVESLKAQYGLLTRDDLAKLSKGARDRYHAKLNGSTDLPRIGDHPILKALSAYAAHELLTRHERLGDAIQSKDADIMTEGYRSLRNLAAFKSTLAELGVPFPDSIINYLRFDSATMHALIEHYDDGVRRTKAFRAIGDPKMDPALLERLIELNEGGPIEGNLGAENLRRRLSDAERTKLDQWRSQQWQVNEQKRQFVKTDRSKNAYFFYELHEDAARGTLRLKSQAGVELHFVPPPRPFHAFFAGRKKGECVGGRGCDQLTPRRWARMAFEDAQTLFTEKGDGLMEGYVGLMPIQNKDTKERYVVVDLLSQAIKGDVVVTSQQGRPVKFSFFDQFIEKDAVPKGYRGFVISDGNAVSMNVGGGEVVEQAPSYREDIVVGRPDQFEPTDKMAKAIAEHYPGGMYPGGMIYDGMKRDGTKVVLLAPKAKRKPVSKEALEKRILKRLLIGDSIRDNDYIWKLAAHNDIDLSAPTPYRDGLLTTYAPQVDELISESVRALRGEPMSYEVEAALDFLTKVTEHSPDTAALRNQEFLDAVFFHLNFRESPQDKGLMKRRKILQNLLIKAADLRPQVMDRLTELVSQTRGAGLASGVFEIVSVAMEKAPGEEALVNSKLLSIATEISNGEHGGDSNSSATDFLETALKQNSNSPVVVDHVRQCLSSCVDTHRKTGMPYSRKVVIDILEDIAKERSVRTALTGAKMAEFLLDYGKKNPRIAKSDLQLLGTMFRFTELGAYLKHLRSELQSEDEGRVRNAARLLRILITKNPERAEFVTEKFVNRLVEVIRQSPMSDTAGSAASALATAVKQHPSLARLRTREIYEVLEPNAVMEPSMRAVQKQGLPKTRMWQNRAYEGARRALMEMLTAGLVENPNDPLSIEKLHHYLVNSSSPRDFLEQVAAPALTRAIEAHPNESGLVGKEFFDAILEYAEVAGWIGLHRSRDNTFELLQKAIAHHPEAEHLVSPEMRALVQRRMLIWLEREEPRKAASVLDTMLGVHPDRADFITKELLQTLKVTIFKEGEYVFYSHRNEKSRNRQDILKDLLKHHPVEVLLKMDHQFLNWLSNNQKLREFTIESLVHREGYENLDRLLDAIQDRHFHPESYSRRPGIGMLRDWFYRAKRMASEKHHPLRFLEEPLARAGSQGIPTTVLANPFDPRAIEVVTHADPASITCSEALYRLYHNRMRSQAK